MAGKLQIALLAPLLAAPLWGQGFTEEDRALLRESRAKVEDIDRRLTRLETRVDGLEKEMAQVLREHGVR